MNVIHGTGKPVISIGTDVILSGYTIQSLTNGNLTVEITPTTGNLTTLDTTYGLINYLLFSYTSADVLTWGRILSFTETGSDYINVNAWQNGAPAIGKSCFIQNIWIPLPYCQRLTEIWTPDSLVTKLYNGKIIIRKRGFYYAASLDYSGYASKTTILLFKQVLKASTSNIYFIPRADNTQIQYRVDLSPESEIVLNQIQNHAGHTSFIINLIGLDRLSEVPIIDPSLSGGYGDDYGTDYGIGL